MHILFLEFFASEPMPNYPELAKVHRSKGHDVWLGRRTEEGDLQWHDGTGVVHTQPGPSKLDLRTIFATPIARRLGFLRFMLSVRRFVNKHQPDIVHLNPSSLFYVFLVPLFGCRKTLYIMDVRQLGQWEQGGGAFAGFKNWKRRRRLWFNARFIYDHTCFMAEAAARYVLGPSWKKWGSVQRIAVDKGFLDVTPRHDVRDDEPVKFIYIGSLNRPRRLENLINAAAILSRTTRNFRLDLVGPDLSEGYYHRLVSELKLEDVVSISPPIPYADVPRRISEAHVGVAYVRAIPDWDYQPTLKVVEYRAAGIPIVASDNPPNRELVTHGETGLLVQDSPEAFAQAMGRFTVDRTFLRACADKAASSRVRRTWVEVAEQYEHEVYIRPGFRTQPRK